MNNKILIIGANGTIGTELVKILKSKGHGLKLVTSKAPQSDEYVQVNLATGEGVEEAFKGVDKAFFLSPPGYADQYQILYPLIKEAKKQELKKVVLMTAMGANTDENSPFRRAELELEKSGLTYNIVRPNWFLQNFNTFWIQGILEQQQINLPAGDAKVSFVDTRDVSAVIANLLVTNNYKNQSFDLTGQEAVNHSKIALTIGEAINTKIAYSDISPKLLEDQLIHAGLPSDYVEFLLLIFSFLKQGQNIRITNDIEKILKTSPRSLSNYISDYKKYWIK